MSSIRVTSQPQAYNTFPDWVLAAMVGAEFNINGSKSDAPESYAVEESALIHGLRHFSKHPDSSKAADWFVLYLKLFPPPFFVPGKYCEFLP